MANLRPTFHESWYRVADLKARLRPSTQISRQHYRGERWYVVRDPAGNQYHRLSSAAYRFVGLLDGSRTVSEAWESAGGVLADDAPTQPEVVQILSQLHAANLLEANITADAGVLLRRHKQMMKRRLQGRLMNVLFPRIPLWDLDRFLVRWMPVMRIFLSKFGVLLWLAVVIGGIAALGTEWDKLKDSAKLAIAPGNWPFLWATFCIIKLIHELGHGFSCRRFGGEVHELGIMFLVFVPAPYVDASSAWSLPSKWQRMFVGMGGMIFELFVAGICAFIWKYSNPNTLVHALAYNTMFIASVTTILFNANPLLRYDGYYILSDLLEIPNLRQKSMEYSLGLIKRHVFRIKSPIPLPPPGQRVWLFLYAIASGIYRVFVGVMIILVVSNQVPVLGILMALGGVITWLVVPVFKVTNYLLLQPELHRKRGRAIAFSLAVASVLVVLIGLIPFPVRHETTAIVKPMEEQTLRARTPGFVSDILVKDGERVHKGQVLLACYDRNLDSEIAKLQYEIRSIEAQIMQGTVTDPAQRVALEYTKRGKEKELEPKLRKRDDLKIKAPFDGVVVAPLINQLQGKFLKQGEEVATVMDWDSLLIRATVEQPDAALVFMRDPGDLFPKVLGLSDIYNVPDYVLMEELEKQKIKFQQSPPESATMRIPVKSITIPDCTLLSKQKGEVTVEFEYKLITTITGVYKTPGAYDAILGEQEAIPEIGQPDASPTTKPAPGQRHTHWISEHDAAALEVDLTEEQGTTTLVYRILGQKVDVRLASARSENLTARVVSRIPEASTTVSDPAVTHKGGGELQNDPSDPSGKKVTIPVFEVQIRLENPDRKNMPGQRAYVRFTMEKNRPLIWQWGRKFWQMLQTQNAQNKWL